MFNKAAPPVKKQEKPETRTLILPPMTLTVDDLVTELHVSRPTAYELVKQKDFPSFMIGQRILIRRLGLQKWINARCTEKSA